MADNLTPFEEAQNKQVCFIGGLLLMHAVSELVARGEECRKGSSDTSLPFSARAKALQELRTINAQLLLVAQAGVWPTQQELS